MIRGIIALGLSVLIAGNAFSGEKDPYSKYIENRSPETFIEAYKSYEADRADTADYMATLMLAYLNMEEMNRNIDLLAAGIEDLGIMQRFNYANILLEVGRFEEAIGIYRKLNADEPKWSCPWRHRGEAHWKNGEYEDAVACLEKAIETRETHFDAYTQLAEVLTDMKEYSRALEVLEKGLSFHGKDIEDPDREVDMIDIRFLHLMLLRENGRTRDAEILAERLEKLVPGDERLIQGSK